MTAERHHSHFFNVINVFFQSIVILKYKLNMFNANNKDTRTTLIDVILMSLLLTLNACCTLLTQVTFTYSNLTIETLEKGDYV